MRKFRIIVSIMMICVLALAGCQKSEPSVSVNTPDINPKAEAANKDTVDVALYFCYSGEKLLAAETRTIEVPVSTTLENAVINALIAGPSAGLNELSRLFWDGVKLTSLDSIGDILFVTLSEEFVSTQPPENELVLDSTSAPEQKLLALESIASTIIEMGIYSSVQFQVDRGTGTSERITRAEAGMDQNSQESLEPLKRDKNLILTPQNTVAQVLDAFNKKDWARLYDYTAYTSQDGAQKPDSDAFTLAISGTGNSIESYTIEDSNVSYDGQTAIVMLSLTLKTREGDTQERPNFSVILMRESYIWKVSYISVQEIFVNVE